MTIEKEEAEEEEDVACCDWGSHAILRHTSTHTRTHHHARSEFTGLLPGLGHADLTQPGITHILDQTHLHTCAHMRTHMHTHTHTCARVLILSHTHALIHRILDFRMDAGEPPVAAQFLCSGSFECDQRVPFLFNISDISNILSSMLSSRYRRVG